jgi:uncharacterized membrane protein YtjA (UPF0391 family)
MLTWLLIFFVIVLISGVLGFTGIVGEALLLVFRIIFSVFLILLLITLIMHFLR